MTETDAATPWPLAETERPDAYAAFWECVDDEPVAAAAASGDGDVYSQFLDSVD